MAARVELVFDFVSPNAYLVWCPLRELVNRYEASLDVVPVFLGGMHKLTGNAPPMSKYRMHPAFPFNSILLQRMLYAADQDGRGVQFAEGLLGPIWEEGLDIASPEAIGAAVAAAGFDAADLFARAQTDEVKQGLVANTDAAVARGAFGIPTMWVNGTEMFFGKERLGQIEELLAKG